MNANSLPIVRRLVATAVLSLSVVGVAGERTLSLFAAASTREVVEEAVKAFERKTGVRVKLNMASSGSLARQIDAGAPADVFLSASPRWSTWLAGRGGVRTESVRELMRNRLVLVAPRDDTPPPIRFDSEFAFAETFRGRLSLGDPEHVPAGRYAMDALKFYGWDKTVAKRLLPAQDVRAAMLMVELGQCDLGIVYATDARASAKVRVVATFPEKAHSPIVYTLSVCSDSRSPAEARKLWTYLTGKDVAPTMTARGFTPAGGDEE